MVEPRTYIYIYIYIHTHTHARHRTHKRFVSDLTCLINYAVHPVACTPTAIPGGDALAILGFKVRLLRASSQTNVTLDGDVFVRNLLRGLSSLYIAKLVGLLAGKVAST